MLPPIGPGENFDKKGLSPFRFPYIITVVAFIVFLYFRGQFKHTSYTEELLKNNQRQQQLQLQEFEEAKHSDALSESDFLNLRSEVPEYSHFRNETESLSSDAHLGLFIRKCVLKPEYRNDSNEYEAIKKFYISSLSKKSWVYQGEKSGGTGFEMRKPRGDTLTKYGLKERLPFTLQVEKLSKKSGFDYHISWGASGLERFWTRLTK